MIIGICGGSGSGKTTLLRRLCNEFKDLNPCVFSMDNYYHPIEAQLKDDSGVYNFDVPSALDEKLLTSDLTKLSEGESVLVKEYHFNSPPDKNVLLNLDPSELIIVEGLFLFHFLGVHDLLDYSVFIEVEPKIQLDRRLYRDQETRGYTREAIIYQWDNHVIPCYEKYLLPYRTKANFIFRNDEFADEDFNSLVTNISIEIEAIKA